MTFFSLSLYCLVSQHTFVLIVYKLDENCLKLEVAHISSSRRSDTKLDVMHMINGYKRYTVAVEYTIYYVHIFSN